MTGTSSYNVNCMYAISVFNYLLSLISMWGWGLGATDANGNCYLTIGIFVCLAQLTLFRDVQSRFSYNSPTKTECK